VGVDVPVPGTSQLFNEMGRIGVYFHEENVLDLDPANDTDPKDPDPQHWQPNQH
jgi:hypothetical protein